MAMAPLVDRHYIQKIKEHYLPLLSSEGDSHRAVDWGSAVSQQRRFEVLIQVTGQEMASLLDVGCGIGHLIDFLIPRGFQGEYLGIDLLPEMVAKAAKRHPACRFAAADLFGGDEALRADYVVGSGLFTFADQEFMESMIARMFTSCHKAVAVNTLSQWSTQHEAGEFHADPIATLAFCRTLTPWVVMRHDYHPGDFTVYLYREPMP